MTADHLPADPLPAVWLIGEALLDTFTDACVPGGAPFNVARSMAALGQPALLISRIGAADPGGAVLLDEMRRLGMDERGLQRDPLHPTGRVHIEQDADGGHRFDIADDAAWDHLDATAAAPLLREGRPALLYFGTLAQRHSGSRAAVQTLLSACAPDTWCYLDLNLRAGAEPGPWLEPSLLRADWLKVNEEELRWLLDRLRLSSPVDLVQHCSLRRLIVTRAAAGYAAYDAEQGCVADAAGVVPARVVDSVGAGDAFSAMLLTASLRGLGFTESLALANRYASAICGVRGPLPSEPGFFAPWRAALPGQACATQPASVESDC